MSHDDPASEDGIPVRIVEYDPAWPSMFEAMAAELWEACGNSAFLRIDHIGSTAVPGLAAKPVIDLSPIVASFDAAFSLIPKLEAIGYIYRGEYGIPRRHYFVYREPYTRHLHIIEDDNEAHRKHIVFRDYLRANPEAAAAYAEMKRDAAARYGANREVYTNAKTPFIESALRLAGYQELANRD